MEGDTSESSESMVSPLISVVVPVVNGSPAYDYEVSSGWTEIESDPAAGEYVYGYGSNTELNVIGLGDSTDPLVENCFTMRSSITGAGFNAMSEINLNFTGYMIDASEDSEAGRDPGTVWGMIPH